MYSCEHGGDIYRNKNIKTDLSKSINPLGMPRNIKSVLRDNVDLFENYPDVRCELLRRKIAERENVSADNIVCGNGAVELIHAICRALRPNSGRIFPPSFSEYEKALRLSGCEITNGNSDLAFICTPNNPTGKLLPIAKLKELSEQNRFLVADECFIDFTEGESFAAYLNEHPNVIVLKSFTKVYCLAGLRLGYIICTDTDLLSAIQNQLPCWNVSVPAQIAGIAALENKNLIPETIKYVRREREFLVSNMRKSVNVYESDANFIFFETDKPVYEYMISEGILIRRWDKTHYRIAVSTRKNNKEFIKCLNQL